MSRLWILGAGQLGRMLAHAAIPLALDVRPIPLDGSQLPDPAPEDLVTAEIEHWPDNAATRRLADHPNLVNRAVFPRLADRLAQKALLDELGIPTAPWRPVEAHTTAADLWRALGPEVLLKFRRGGYDGRGQQWLREAAGDELPAPARGAAIAEARVPFDEEVSLIGARGRSGEQVFFPLTLNLHQEGILTASLAPVRRLSALEAEARRILGRLLEALDYVGVMAVECFRVGDRLWVNELAPRVHNTGHWTQAGCAVSQFELHLRALFGLPLPEPHLKGITAMVNLVGVERDDRWLALPQAELFWYGKAVRPGRKVGHLNFCLAPGAPSPFPALRPLLPERYAATLDWLEAALAPP